MQNSSNLAIRDSIYRVNTKSKSVRSLIVKAGCFVILVSSLGACETAKRFAPPGFIKYEDLAKDIPVDPAIQARIDSVAVNKEADYPDLSQTPSEIPKGETKRVRELTVKNLIAVREVIDTDIARARSLAEAEFELETKGERDITQIGQASVLPDTEQIIEDIEKTRKEAQEEAAKSLPAPLDLKEAPEQNNDFDG